MPSFEVYVDDDRYSVPSLYLITADSDAGACAMAEQIWRDSDHHRGVELRRDGERMLARGSYGARAADDEQPTP